MFVSFCWFILLFKFLFFCIIILLYLKQKIEFITGSNFRLKLRSDFEYLSRILSRIFLFINHFLFGIHFFFIFIAQLNQVFFSVFYPRKNFCSAIAQPNKN